MSTIITIIIKLVKLLTVFGIVIWVLIAIAVFGLWKNFYYYPQYNLYIYADGGVVGNRTILLGESPDSMNTILRFDFREDFGCYISKAEDHYYIYWPEDTTSFHYENIIFKHDSISSFTPKMKYDAYLRDYYSNNANFSLVTYVHQTPDNWIDASCNSYNSGPVSTVFCFHQTPDGFKDAYKLFTDTLHWGMPGMIRFDDALRIFALNPKEKVDIRHVSIKECGLLTYMKNFFKPLDEKTVMFFLVLFFCIILYYSMNIIERRINLS